MDCNVETEDQPLTSVQDYPDCYLVKNIIIWVMNIINSLLTCMLEGVTVGL